jgi:putative effector of murein hydrolase
MTLRLGPATVALALPLHKNRQAFFKNMSIPRSLLGYLDSSPGSLRLRGWAQQLGSQAALLFALLWLTGRSPLQEASQRGLS